MDNFIQLEGTINTRDLGGLLTVDGKKIKKGIIYRSDKLSNLTENDKKKLNQLGIKYIFDFRSKHEKVKEPNNIPNNIKYIEIPIEPESMDINSFIKNNNINDLLINENKRYASIHSKSFFDFLNQIIKNKEPFLYHCTMGKDRTGYATLLILNLLNIPEKTIIENYMLTNTYIKDNIDEKIKNIMSLFEINEENSDIIKPLFFANYDYLNAAINTINKSYNKISNYIKINTDSNYINEFKNYILE